VERVARRAGHGAKGMTEALGQIDALLAGERK
jgi:hypothetical protein